MVEKLTGTEPEDVYLSVARLHKKVISEGFLAKFSDRFLASLYRSIALGPGSFLIIDGELGFIAGSMDTGSVYKSFVKRNGLKAFVQIAPKLVSPQKLFRIFETLVYPSRKRRDDLPEPEILNFCVAPESQGQGVGSVLFDHLVEEFRRLGIDSIRIVTGSNQESAQRFYAAKGAQLAATIELHKGTKSLVYVYRTAGG